MQIRNPRTGKYDYEIQEDSLSDVSQTAIRLRENQQTWAERPIEEKVKYILQLADAMDANKEKIISALSIDTGRTRISEIEYSGAIGVIRGRCYSSPALYIPAPARNSVTCSTVQIHQQLVPYNLVGIISPWNFPLLLAMIDTIPALLAGCAVLLKPSEVTPRFIQPMEEILKDIPELHEVLHIVKGGVESGKAVVENVDAICFTGSVPTGKIIAKRCAERFIPAFLELGGKDPAIVMADADLDLTAEAIIRSAVGATGQACQSLERIYVHESISEELTERIIAKVNELKLNTDDISHGTLGPLIFHKQSEIIKNQIEDAIAKGAIVHTGGVIENHNGGLWMHATVISNVTHDMDIMTEETFGPVIPIMPYSNLDKAIEWCNNTVYGLSASVFSQDNDQAIKVAYQIEAGGISINDASLTNKVFDATKNSFKDSGMNGSRMGSDGFLRFFRKKAILIQGGTVSSILEQSETV